MNCKSVFAGIFLLTFFAYLPAQVTSSIDYRLLNDADTNKSRILLDMGSAFYKKSQYDSAYYYAMKSYALCLKQNYTNGLIKNLNNGGLSQAYLGNYEEARKLLKAGLDICIRHKNEKQRARLLNSLGLCETREGRYKEAIQLYLQALKIQEKSGDSAQIGNAYNNIGVVYSRTQNFAQAKDHYRKSLSIRKALKDSIGIALCYNNLANTFTYYDSKNVDSIIYFMHLSLDIREKIKNEFGIAQSHLNMGNYYLNTYKPEEALLHYQKADSMFTRMGVENEMIVLKGNLAETYLDLKKFPEAKKYGEEALRLATSAGLREEMASGYKKMAKVYMRTGEYRDAAESYKKFFDLQEEFSSNELDEKLLEARYDFEYESKQEKLKIAQEKKDLLAREEKSRQRLIIVAVSVVVFLVFLIVVIFFRNKAKLAGELKKRNVIIQDALNDREVLLKEIHHRVKNNLQIISSLLNLQHSLAGQKNAEEILKICESRIQSMAIIHEKLYQSENFKEIVLQEYLVDFLGHLRQSLFLEEKNISVELRCDDIRLDVDRLVPCSLVLNELIINSVKHGLKNSRSGVIHLECRKEEQKVKIIVADNGAGLPADFDFNKYQSLGMKLVKGLMRQIKGDIKNTAPANGACFEISFNLD